jgi:hypothetical protein
MNGFHPDRDLLALIPARPAGRCSSDVLQQAEALSAEWA